MYRLPAPQYVAEEQAAEESERRLLSPLGSSSRLIMDDPPLVITGERPHVSGAALADARAGDVA